MIRYFALAGLLLVVAATGFAQRGGGGGGRGGNSSMGDNIPMMASRPNRLDIITEYMKLSKDQRKDVKNIMDEGQKEAAPVRDQMAKASLEVGAAVAGGKADEIERATKSYVELQTKMTAIEMKAFAAVYKLLDSDQQQKTGTVFPMMNGIFNGKNWTEVAP